MMPRFYSMITVENDRITLYAQQLYFKAFILYLSCISGIIENLASRAQYKGNDHFDVGSKWQLKYNEWGKSVVILSQCSTKAKTPHKEHRAVVVFVCQYN